MSDGTRAITQLHECYGALHYPRNVRGHPRQSLGRSGVDRTNREGTVREVTRVVTTYGFRTVSQRNWRKPFSGRSPSSSTVTDGPGVSPSPTRGRCGRPCERRSTSWPCTGREGSWSRSRTDTHEGRSGTPVEASWPRSHPRGVHGSSRRVVPTLSSLWAVGDMNGSFSDSSRCHTQTILPPDLRCKGTEDVVLGGPRRGVKYEHR